MAEHNSVTVLKYCSNPTSFNIHIAIKKNHTKEKCTSTNGYTLHLINENLPKACYALKLLNSVLQVRYLRILLLPEPLLYEPEAR